jgi:hypothetical protein
MSKFKDNPESPTLRKASRPALSADYQPGRKTRTFMRFIVPLTLFLGSLFLYVAFRSASLDDFDSYSFALALDHYSLPLQQPHPPGFPIYITLGRLLKFPMGSATAALTTLSALSGAASVVLTYHLGRAIDPEYPTTGLTAALLVAFLPVHWLTAEKALSDALGLAAMLLPLWLWARWIREGASNIPWIAALFTGLMLGVRPQNALPFVILAFYLVFRTRHAFHPVSVLACVLGVLTWLIPVAASMDGVESNFWAGFRLYIEMIMEHAAHVGRADAVTGMSGSLPSILRRRWIAFVRTLIESNLGFTLQEPGSTRTLLIMVSTGLAVVPGLLAAGWHRPKIRWIGLWLLSVVLQILFLETLDRPRLLLPVVPPLALLIAAGWSRWRLPDGLRIGVIAVVPLLLIRIGLPWAATLSNVPAPPAQATAYIADRYPSETTLIAAAGSYRAVQKTLPEYRRAYLYQFDPEAVRRWVSEDVNHVIILDRDQFPNDVIEVLTDEGRWVPIEDRVFARNRKVHTQHDQVRIQVLTQAATVRPDALALDDDGCIDIGSETDGRYLGLGWFRAESVGGVEARWAGGIPTSTLRIKLSADQDYELNLRGIAYPEEQVVTLRVGGQDIDRGDLPTTWTVIPFSLPADGLDAEGMTTLTFVHSAAVSPAEATGGTSSDPRVLTAAYDWLCVSSP